MNTPEKNSVYLTRDGNKMHKSKGCIHLRYARRRNTLIFVRRSIAEHFATDCKTCFPSASTEGATMTQYIIFNPENLRPVDVTIPNEDGDSLYVYCDQVCEDLESKGKHVAPLMFDDYVEDAMVSLPNAGVTRRTRMHLFVNWITRFKSVTEQRDNYEPRHAATPEESALMALRYKLTGHYERYYTLPVSKEN